MRRRVRPQKPTIRFVVQFSRDFKRALEPTGSRRNPHNIYTYLHLKHENPIQPHSALPARNQKPATSVGSAGIANIGS
jgi:hypothetical protein